MSSLEVSNYFRLKRQSTLAVVLVFIFGFTNSLFFEPQHAQASCLVNPTVTTSAATGIGASTAIGNGNVTSSGSGTITERGVVWSTSANPTTADSKATATGTTGIFGTNITNLSASTLYHYRAFATGCGTGYGSDTTFTTSITQTVIFLTSGTSWTVPSDWSSATNTIEVIGGGASGGGGAGYAKATNVSLTAGATVGVKVGSGGTSGSGAHAGNDTYLCNDTSNCASISGTAVKVGAKGGGTSSGGAASSAVGGAGGGTLNPGAPYAYSGGNLVTNSGGGAAGPHGAGGKGSGAIGGTGDNGYGGSGTGLAVGGAGTEWDATHGSGGGSGGTNGATYTGGNYGGASGQSGLSTSAAGAQGIIVVSYTAFITTPPRMLRLSGGLRIKGGVRLR